MRRRNIKASNGDSVGGGWRAQSTKRVNNTLKTILGGLILLLLAFAFPSMLDWIPNPAPNNDLPQTKQQENTAAQHKSVTDVPAAAKKDIATMNETITESASTQVNTSDNISKDDEKEDPPEDEEEDEKEKEDPSWTALIKAIREQDSTRAMTELGKVDVDLEAKDNKGRTALIHAVQVCDLPTFAALLKKGAEPEVQDIGDVSAFMHAAAHCSRKVVQELLNAGVETIFSDHHGFTALHHYVAHFPENEELHAASVEKLKVLVEACKEVQCVRIYVVFT